MYAILSTAEHKRWYFEESA